MEYTLIRSRRKTLEIRVRTGAGVEARAPLDTPIACVEDFIASKEAWILKMLAAQRLNLRAPLNYGSKAPFMGEDFLIVARDGDEAGFDGERFYIPVGQSLEAIRKLIITALKKAGEPIFKRRAAYYADIMGLYPSTIKVSAATSRWGSCSSKNRVNFSWMLAAADEALIDYVVTHELAHIAEHNHSPRFWALVKGVLPDYKERERELRNLRKKLGEWM
ncbi:MAG: M48 family metallopeptidase [Clostridiales bacterium]|nr:M48 family metallopeptidase [Clostridiales bacterium]